MVKNRYPTLFVALAAIVWTPLALSAQPANGPATRSSHAPERPDEPAVSPGSPELDAQIAHLRAIRERLSRANSPEERQALMAERAKVMQEAMATMHKTAGMPGPYQGAGRAGMGGRVAAGQAGNCYHATEQHMALMQEMMQAMMESQAMGGGMGHGMGKATGGGMMSR
jgi:hypothetical protein